MAVFDNGYKGRKVSALQLPLSASAAGLNLSGLSAATGSAVGSDDGIAALKLDLSQLQALGAAPAIGDFLSVLDASAFDNDNQHHVLTKKMTVQQLGETLANPPSADGDSLGTASLEWSDLYLADGGVIYMGNSQDVTITHDGSAGLGIVHAGAFDLDAGGAMTLDAASFTVGGDGDTGAIAMDSTAGISLDGANDSNFTLSDGDLSLIADGSDNKVVIKGDHESDVAIHLDGNAAAGSIVDIDAGVLDIDATGAATLDAGGSITLTGAGVLLAGGSSEVDITTSGAFDVNVGSVDLDSTAGIAMDGTTVSIDGTDDSNLTVTASGKDLDIAVAGGGTQELRLASAGTGASALHLNASVGSVDIDSADNITMDAADDIALTTTSADGLITLHSAHTAGQAILIDANAAAGSILDVDAGIMDVDVQGAYSLDAGGAIGITGVGVDVNAGSGTLELTSTGAVDVNGAAVTVDGTTVSVDGSDDMNFTMAANDGSAKTITIAASNSGSGAGNIALSADTVSIAGNLSVTGTTTTVSSTNTVVADKLIELGNGTSGSASGDAGIVIERGDDTNVAIVWDESADEFFLGSGSVTGASSGDLSLTAADLQAGVVRSSKLEIDAAGNNIDVDTDLKLTAVAGITLDAVGDIILDADDADVILKDGGTESARFTMNGTTSVELAAQGDIILDPAGNNVLPGGDSEDDLGADGTAWRKLFVDDIDLNGVGRIDLDADADTSIRASADDVITFEVAGTDEFQMDTNMFGPSTAGQADLGGTSNEWSNLFLADGGIIKFGSDQDISMTHVVATSLGSDVKSSGGASSINDASLTNGSTSIQFFGLGSDIKDTQPTVSFSDFPKGNVSNTSLDGSTSTITFSSPIGINIDGGTTVIFQHSGGNYQFTIPGSVSSSATSFGISSITGDNISSGLPDAIISVSKQLAAHKSGLNQSSFSASTTSLAFTNADQASAFASAAGGGGAVVRFADSSATVDLTLSSYSSGTSIGVSSASMVSGSSVSLSGLQSSGSIKVKSTSSSAAATAASTFASAIGATSGGTPTVRFDDGGGNTIDFVFSAYSSGTSLSMSSSSSSATIALATLLSGGSIKVVSEIHDLQLTDSLDLTEHDGSSVGLHLNGTLVTSTAAELNIMDGDTSDSAVTLVDADQIVVNDGGTMKQSAVTSLAPYLAGDGLSVSSNKLVITSKNESAVHAGSTAQEIALSSKVFDSGNSQASASTFSGSSVTFRILKADRVHSPVVGKQITVGSYTATISSVTTTTVSSSNDAWQVVLGSGSGSSGSATTISFAKDGTFFDLAETPAADSLMVFVNGILQTVSTHYSLSSDKVAMADGNALPDDGSAIEFRYIKG